MATYLDENLSIIQHRWPEVAQALATAPEPRAEVVQDGPQATLLIDGIHLTSSYDRPAEARLQATMIPEESTEAWIYGFGLGDLPRELLNRRQLKKIHVVIMNHGKSKLSCRKFDHTGWLKDPRISLMSARSIPTLRFPFAALPSSLQLAEDGASRLRDLVVLALSTPFIGSKHRADDPQLRQRLLENENFVLQDGDVASLFGSLAGKNVVVAGAGPTLSRHYEHLRLKRADYSLIAVDAALSPLLKAGIQPDLVVVVDGHVADSVVRREMPAGSQEHWVLNGHGNRVPTSLAMRGFLRDLETFIERHPEVQFVNGSREGALIRGADYCGWV